VPFRGELLCSTCAARALGSPGPEPPNLPAPSSRPDLVAGIVLIVGLMATIPPWHRAGSLSGTLSVWTPSGEMPVFVAVLALAGAAVLTIGPALWRRPSRRQAAAAAALSLVAGGAIAFSLLRAPDFFSFTPAPFVTLGAAAVGAILCGIRAQRLRTPRP
jgi:peptidoglycan/LPS O-acetylase OafA/YrhL